MLNVGIYARKLLFDATVQLIRIQNFCYRFSVTRFFSLSWHLTRDSVHALLINLIIAKSSSDITITVTILILIQPTVLIVI